MLKAKMEKNKKIIVAAGGAALVVVISLISFFIYQASDSWPVIPTHQDAQNLKVSEDKTQKLVTYTVGGYIASRSLSQYIAVELDKLGWGSRLPTQSGAQVKVLRVYRLLGLVCDLYRVETTTNQAQTGSPTFIEMKVTKMSCAEY